MERQGAWAMSIATRAEGLRSGACISGPANNAGIEPGIIRGDRRGGDAAERVRPHRDSEFLKRELRELTLEAGDRRPQGR